MTSKALFLALLITLTLKMSDGQGTCGCATTGTSCIEQVSPPVNNCDPSASCPCTQIPLQYCPAGAADVNCTAPGGTGDPHFLGFDGSSFYFHGINGHSYLIYGTRDGDSLVARVRATNELSMGENMTYFEEFGFKLGSSSHAVRFFLQKSKTSGWMVKGEVNGAIISSDQLVGKSSIKIKSTDSKYTVTTPLNKFTIQGVSLNSKYRRHLDFQVQIRNVRSDQLFSGILGRTVNRQIAYRIRKTDTLAKKKQFEFKMRELYDVPSLFPSHQSLMNRQFVASDVHKNDS